MNPDVLSFIVPAVLIVGFIAFKRLGQIKPEDARRMVQEGAVLVDVRSAGEFSSGHLPGALNVPLQELGAKVGKLCPKDKPIILYCASGTRSSMARGVLKRLGFTQAHNLGRCRAGPIDQRSVWVAAFGVTTRTTSAKTRAVFTQHGCQGGGGTWAAILAALDRREGSTLPGSEEG